MTLFWPQEPSTAGRDLTTGTDPQEKSNLSPPLCGTLSALPLSSLPRSLPRVTSAGSSAPAPRYLPPPTPARAAVSWSGKAESGIPFPRGLGSGAPPRWQVPTPLYMPRVSVGCAEVPPPNPPGRLRTAFPESRGGNGVSPGFPRAP